jgi:hypothetical protein
MADDGGVLGNLPRSRPGHRSEKRTGKTAAKAAAGRSGDEAAAAAAKARAPKRPEPSPTGGEPSASRPGDPVGDAVRAVTGIAATGARVAGGVAREVLRRLPRP